MVFLDSMLASFLTASFTALGGFLIFFKKNYNKSAVNFLLNVAAGIMLASAFFTLLAPALLSVETLHLSKNYGAMMIVLSVLLGFAVVWLLDMVVPHEHENGEKKGIDMSVSAAWLFVFAIAIHKLPEGVAIGVAVAGGEVFSPKALITGIAIQNVPEGLMVALALVAIGFSRLKAFLFSVLTGLMQPLGALLGVLATSWSEQMIPFGMAMAGGCMLFVIINEVIPETYSSKESEQNAWGIFAGFLFMTYMAVVMS